MKNIPKFNIGDIVKIPNKGNYIYGIIGSITESGHGSYLYYMSDPKVHELAGGVRWFNEISLIKPYNMSKEEMDRMRKIEFREKRLKKILDE